eukprot:TRINITY_DN7932_c0_g1_i1.p1 TRINITY_DN7932_c0_g1~~TRINITY_DN7932_c0_g1_i1.p1  ORF type:complete len:2355 (-),score=202.05 TRINITY_DN7932_c0_g1_i1:1135-8112(-)
MPSEKTFWNRFWFLYGKLFWEERLPPKWGTVFKHLSDELFSGPLRSIASEDTDAAVEEAIFVFENFNIDWGKPDILALVAKILDEKIELKKAASNVFPIVNSRLILAEGISSGLGPELKYRVFEVLLKKTIDNAILWRMSINFENIGELHKNTLRGIVTHRLTDNLSSIPLKDSQTSSLVLNFLTPVHIVEVLKSSNVQIQEFREILDHVASKGIQHAEMIFAALIDKVNLPEIAKLHIIYPKLMSNLRSTSNKLESKIRERVSALMTARHSLSIDVMRELNSSEPKQPGRGWLTQRLAKEIVDFLWRNATCPPLHCLCDWLEQFFANSTVPNAPRFPCTLHTMLTIAVIEKVIRNVETCWRNLPANFCVLFARDSRKNATRLNNIAVDADLVPPITNLYEVLMKKGNPSVPLEDLKHSELSVYVQFWNRLRDNYICELVTLPDAQIFYKAEEQMIEAYSKLREAKLMITWLNDKEFDPRIALIPNSDGLSLNEVSKLLALPITDYCYQFLRFFLTRDSALFNIVFDDVRKNDPGLKVLTTEALHKFIGRTEAYLRNLNSLSNLDKLSEYHSRLQSRFSQEIAILADHFKEDTINALTFEKDLDHAFQLLEYINNVQYLVECLQSLGLFPEECAKLQQIHEKKTTVQSLKMAQVWSELTNISAQVPGLLPAHLEFFMRVNLSKPVVMFLLEFADDSFSTQVQFLNDQLQGFQHGLDLVTETVSVRQSLSPLLTMLRSKEAMSFGQFCRQMAFVLGTATTRHSERLHYVSTKLSEVRVNFKGGANLTIEEMIPYVDQLLNKGYYTSRTARHASGEDMSFKFKEPTADVDRVFPAAALQELIVAINVFAEDNITESKQEQLREFIHLHNLASRIHEMHVVLEETGHPDYQQVDAKLNEAGGLTVAHYQAKLDHLTEQHNEWKQMRLQMKDRSQLLSNPQIATLIKSIRANQDTELYPYCWMCLPDILAMGKAISTEVIASCFREAKSRITALQVSINDSIAIFTALLELAIKKTLKKGELEDMQKVYPGAELVMANGMNSTQLFYIAVELNGELPHPAQVLACTRETKKEDVLRIVKCAQSLPWLSFMMTEVNNLRMEVRSALTNELLSLEKQKRKYSLKLIFTAQTGVSSFSFISQKAITQEMLEKCTSYLHNNSIHFKPATVRQRYFTTLGIVQGDPGVGKSTSIRHYFAQQRMPCIEIPIQEGFTAASLIHRVQKSLRRSPNLKNIGIHLNILPYADFAHVREFLYSWILFGVIYDSKIGEMFHLPAGFSWHVLVEIGCAPIEDKEYEGYNSCAKVLTALPALTFIAESKDVLLKRLLLDDDMRLACAFYRVYKDNEHVSIGVARRIKPLTNDTEVYSTMEQVKDDLTVLGENRHMFIFQRMFLHLLAVRCKWIKLFADNVITMSGTYAEGQFFFRQYMKYFIEEVAHYCNANNSLAVTSLPVSLREDNSFTFVDCRQNISEKQVRLGSLHVTSIEEITAEPEKLLPSLALALGITDTARMINVIRQQRFTMTLDFVVKLLLLNDRRVAGQSIVFKGDTGLGKTETLDLFALLLNCNQALVPDIIANTVQFITKSVLQSKEIKTPESWSKHVEKLSQANPTVTDILSVIRTICNELRADGTAVGQVTYFSFVAQQLLQFIKNMLAEFPLLEFPSAGTIKRSANFELRDLNELFQLLEELMTAKITQLFHKITMHAGMTSELLRMKINELKAVSKKIDKCPNVRLVVFIDEFNTTSIMGMVKSILFDHRLDGELLPSNIFFAAAMNPYTKKESSSELDYTGVESATKILPFIVRPNPKAIDLLTVSFSNFDEEQEKRFLAVLCSTRKDLGTQDELKVVKEFLLAGQQQLRAANMERIHVSIRDIMRAIDLFVYFYKNPAGLALLGLQPTNAATSLKLSQRFWFSLFMACNIAYLIRLGTTAQRTVLLQMYSQLCKTNNYGPEMPTIEHVITQCYQQLYESTTIPDGIAGTRTLMENLFVTVACVDTKIPLMIIGPAGTSKTLSFTIAADNMRNAAATKALYHSLSHVHPFRYQCTQNSTDTEVDGVYQSAIRRQKFFENASIRNVERSTVFLDEANLPGDFEMPLKVLHYHLDHPAVSSVILCNRILDAPKTNRAVVLQLPTSLTREDLYALAKGIFSSDQNVHTNKQLLTALCTAFWKISSSTKDFRDRFFQHRDFIYFLRYIRAGIGGREARQSLRITLTSELLIQALERNFNGIPFNLFCNIVRTFVEELQQATKDCTWHVEKIAGALQNRTMQLIEENLNETLKPEESPNMAPFRYMMLVDPTDSEAAVSLFLSICKRKKTRSGSTTHRIASNVFTTVQDK